MLEGREFVEQAMVQLFQKIKNADFEYPEWFSDEGECFLLLFCECVDVHVDVLFLCFLAKSRCSDIVM